MTKGTKTFLIFSVSLIAIGIALMSTGLFMGGSLFTNFSFSGGKLNVFNNSSELKEGTIPCDAFDSVCVDTSVTDICFEKGTAYSVSYCVREEFVPQVSQQDGRLTVFSGESSFGINFGIFNSGSDKKELITITVPEDFYDEAELLKLEVNGSTADVTVNDLNVSGKIELSTGDIKLNNLKDISSSLSLETTTGDKKLNNCSLGELTLKSSTGDTKINNCTIDAALISEASTGELHIDNSSAGSIDCTSTTGDITISDFSSDRYKLKTSTGDIKMKISGNEKEFDYDVHTSTGDIKIDGNKYEKSYEHTDYSSKKLINAKTSTGSITVDFT